MITPKQRVKKGKEGEREVAKILNHIMGTNLRRTPQSGGLSIKGDIIDTQPGDRIHEYHIEIKFHKTIKFKEWIQQSEADCGSKMPTVIFPRIRTTVLPHKPPINEKIWYVAVELTHWANELKRNDGLEKENAHLRKQLEVLENLTRGE